MLANIKLFLAQAKFIILSVLWAASLVCAIWLTYSVVTGLEAKKTKTALENAITEKNKISLELRQYREKAENELESAQGKILHLEGVRLDNENNNKNCNTNNALFSYIELRRAIQKELSNL